MAKLRRYRLRPKGLALPVVGWATLGLSAVTSAAGILLAIIEGDGAGRWHSLLIALGALGMSLTTLFGMATDDERWNRT